MHKNFNSQNYRHSPCVDAGDLKKNKRKRKRFDNLDFWLLLWPLSPFPWASIFQAYNLSRDHKPDLEVEKERILKAGGFIHAGRVNGSLNLARAIGILPTCMWFVNL